MTAFAPFPPVPGPTAAVEPPPSPGAEAQLAAAVLHLGRDGAAARLDAVFGPGAARPILRAHARLSAVLGQADGNIDAMAMLIDTALRGPDGEERARPLALHLVPAHRMSALVTAARDFGLALRRAALRARPTNPPCPGAPH